MKGSAEVDKRTLLTNAIWNCSGFAVSVAITFVMCPILIHGLGDQRYGIWSLIQATVAYMALLDVGIGASVVRYVAKFEEIQDKDRLNRVFSTTLCIFLCGGAIAVVLSAGTALLWQQPFGVPSEIAAATRWLILLLGANVAAELVLGVYGAVLYGLGRFPAKVSIETGLRITTAGAIVAVLIAGGGLVGLAIVVLASTLTKGLIGAIAVHRYLPNLRFSLTLVSLETFRTIRGYSARAFVAMIAGRISYSSDAIVIGAFLAPEYITYFVVAARLTEYVKSGIRSMTVVITPAASALDARGDHQVLRRVFLDGTRYVLWVVLPMEVGLLILGKPFLSLWLGERYANLSYPALVILSVPLFLSLSQSISGRILYGTGNLRWFARLAVAQALTNLSLSVALVRPLGIEGVAIGTAVPSLIHATTLAVYVSHTLGVPLLEYLRRSFLTPILLLGLPATVWLVSGPFTSWGSFVLAGVMGMFCYLVPAFLLEFGSTFIGHLTTAMRFVPHTAVEDEVQHPEKCDHSTHETKPLCSGTAAAPDPCEELRPN